MKFISALRFVALAVCILSAGILFSQQLQHEVKVVNIEISTRVYKGDTFIDNLTLNDFEVLDDGKPQQIEAVYLIKKTDIKREEGKKGIAPLVAREFVLFFEMMEYLPEIDNVLDYFFDKVILPGDAVIVITPMNSYNMRSDALAKLSKATLKGQLRGKLRKDILMGSSEYTKTIDDLYMTLANDSPLDEKLHLYSVYLAKLESLRRVNEKGLFQFADFLKSMPGQKYVYMFYQKESIPQYNPKLLMQLETANQDDVALTFQIMEKFSLFSREIGFNVDAVKKAYSDSSIAIHFLFLTKMPAVRNPVSTRQSSAAPSQIVMVERSEDIFSAFNQVAQATGGISESSANARSSFQRAVDASENYYLIYYKPQDYKADGKFHEVKIKVKTGNFAVLHRAGYFAN